MFFTTKAKGSGLGLSQVFRMVESHGGQVGFESRKGNGTVFRLEIPLEDI
ncbi:MAG TPA: ATP-binding protein [bacterium]|nr:ATP-binding protein [bacterium]